MPCDEYEESRVKRSEEMQILRTSGWGRCAVSASTRIRGGSRYSSAWPEAWRSVHPQPAHSSYEMS